MLIGVELVQEFVESVIMTGRVKGIPPLSTLIIGKPESGKTSIVTEKQCPTIECFSDVTGRGILEIVRDNPQLTHVILNDLVAIMSHKQNVNRYTLAIINALTEEGLQGFATPGGIERIPEGKRGVIACLTFDLASEGRSWWNKTGFSSRLLPFAFAHSSSLSLKIKAYIDNGSHTPKKKAHLRIPAKPIVVPIPPKFVAEIRKISDAKAQEFSAVTHEEGYRRLRQFRSLACGHALRRTFKSPSVGEKEIEFLERVLPYISYTKLNPL